MQTFIISKLLALVAIILSCTFHAQISASGKVNFKNKGVKDISVTLKDTYDGATTDENGNYSFETAEEGNRILVFLNPKFVEIEQAIVIGSQSLTVRKRHQYLE